jgi:hypothetical protein
MSIAEQALFLLDVFPSVAHRRNLENFSNLDQTISASLPREGVASEPVLPPPAAVPESPFSVASRMSMSRSNYEDQARAEALTNALRKLRESHVARSAKSRIIRGRS